MTAFILEFAARSALIALGAAAVLQILHVKSARARHASWTGVLVLMMLLPAWTVWGPRASLRLLPARHSSSAGVSSTGVTLPLVSAAIASPAPVRTPPARPTNWWPAIYFVGAATLLARLALGTWRANRLVRRSLLHEDRLTSAACASPVTVGLLRPAVILPEEWPSWSAAQLDAVLAHEGEHVRRRDPLVQWLALLNRAIFWFHPLAWWLERRLSALAEEACDAAVLACGCDPYDYSHYLLELARSIESAGVRVNVLGMAMPGSSLPQRIRQIVSGGPVPRLTRARALALAVTFLAVSAVFAAATVDRQPSISDPPPPPAAPAPPPTPPTPPAALSDIAPLPPTPPRPAAQANVPPLPPTPPPPAAPTAVPPLPPAPPSPPSTSIGQFVALYVDLRGATADMRSRSIAAAADVLGKLAQSHQVALFTFDGSVRVLQDFTSDRELLRSQLEHLTAAGPAPTLHDQLAALHQVVDKLSPLSGNKALVYSALPAGQVDSTEFSDLIAAAGRASVAFFPISISENAPTVRAGDTIRIAEASDSRFSGTYIVSPEGMLSIPLLGEIKAAGLTADGLRSAVSSRLTALIRNPKLTIEIARQSK